MRVTSSIIPPSNRALLNLDDYFNRIKKGRLPLPSNYLRQRSEINLFMEKFIATFLRTDTQFFNNYKHTNEKRFTDHNRKPKTLQAYIHVLIKAKIWVVFEYEFSPSFRFNISLKNIQQPYVNKTNNGKSS